MPTPVPIPQLGESVKQVKLIRWLKPEGAPVATDEPLCELESDKANADLPSPAAGLLHRLKKDGDTVNVGEVIAQIDESAAKPAAAPPPPAPAHQPSQATQAAPAPAPAPAAAPALSPAVRAFEESKLDVTQIPATGPNQRLTKEDVQRFLAQRDAAKPKPAAPAAPPAARPAAPPAPAAPAPAEELKFDTQGVYRVPMTKIRKRIAERLVAAQQSAAILTTYNEADMSAIADLRSKYKEQFEKMHGVGLGFMSFFSRASILALRDFPKLNAFIDGDDVVYHQYVHLGIAVSTDRGLAVPVLRNAHAMSFAHIETEVKRLATAVRDGKLSIEELSGGTFTITNGGVYGSLFSTPILNPPQSGILGMHAIQKRPVVINDKIEIRPMMYLALSYDHRLVDGRESVSFLVRLKQLLEEPSRLMLEI